jgi:hypothetical protein
MACLALLALEHPMPVGEAQARISALGLGMDRAGGLLSGLIQEGLVQT